MKLAISNEAKSALSSAQYDPKSGKLSIELDENKLLNSKAFHNIRHIDSFKLNGKSYNLNIHADNGPKDKNGRYIYNKATTNHQFVVNVGKNLDLSNGATLKFHDGESGKGPLLHQTTVKSSGSPATQVSQHQQTLSALSGSAKYAGGMTMANAAKALNVNQSRLTQAVRPDRAGSNIGLSNASIGWMKNIQQKHGTEVLLGALAQPNVPLWKPDNVGNSVRSLGREFGNAVAHVLKSGTAAAPVAQKTSEVATQPASSGDYSNGMTMATAADMLNVEQSVLEKAVRPGRYGNNIGLSNNAVGWLKNVQQRHGTGVMLGALSKPYIRLWKPTNTGANVMSIGKQFSMAVQQAKNGN